MKKHSTEWFIFNAFVTSKTGQNEFIPWEQGALLYRVNIRRKQMGYVELNNTSLGRQLSKLKSSGKVMRLRWNNPSDGNIWIWNNGA